MITINGANYTRFAVLPIKKQKTLDESLDVGVLTFKSMSSAEPFEPLSRVSIDGDVFLIAKDDVKQTIFGKNPRYEHNLTLIEETKELEKYFVDSCTITNPLNELASEVDFIYPNIIKMPNIAEVNNPIFIENAVGTVTTYTNPKNEAEVFTFKAFDTIFNNFIGTFGQGFGLFEKRVCKNRVYKDGVLLFETTDDAQGNALTLEKGKYTFEYNYIAEGYFLFIKISEVNIWTVTYSFTVKEAAEPIILQPKTLLDVTSKLLALTEIQRLNASTQFAINPEQVGELSAIESPELNITNCTLREALNIVGSYLHSEVRLRDGMIYFDKLDSRVFAKIPPNVSAYTATHDIEQFCDGIESNVKNLVTDYREQEGNMIEPFVDGYKTLRTETGTVRVDESSGFIETTQKVERIIKVECGFLTPSGGVIEVGDITSRVVAKPVYDSLSSISQTADESKAYHIYYTQGGKHIKGLNFELKDIVGSGVFQEYAITNIINEKLSTSYEDTDTAFIKLQFRVTYEAIINGRFRQFKPYLSTDKKLLLAYNQSAHKVSSTYYGENLKGAVARLGNIEKVYTYIVKNGTEIPEQGQLFDDSYCISVVSTEEFGTYTKVSLGLSKDFNRLNKNVGIRKELRFYEISEQPATERYINYDDFLVLGDADLEEEEFDKSLVNGDFLEAVKLRFKNGTAVDRVHIPKVSCMILEGVDKDLTTTRAEVLLPVATVPYGNSISYLVYYNNNYGAGNYIRQFDLTDVEAITVGRQDELRYTDNLGEIEYLGMKGFSYPYETAVANFADAVEAGATLPNPLDLEEEATLFDTGILPLNIKKDSREQIVLNYSIHCIAKSESVIVGSGLAKKLLAMQYHDTDFVDMYIMSREIGSFEREILDLPATAISYTMTVDSANKKITLGATATSGKAIVLVDRETKELVFAVNGKVRTGDAISLPMNFRHKVRE